MAATTPSKSGSVLPAWMWPSSAAAAAAAAENFERKKTVHEDTARQYRAAAGQLEQMTEGAMSEAMITAHQLLAVDHTNIARIDDEFAATGRRLAEMAHSLSAHLDDIDYEAQQEISASPPARRAVIIAEAHTKATAVLAAFTADVAGVRTQAEKEVGRLAAGIIGRAPSDNHTTQPLDHTTQPLDNSTGERGDGGTKRRSPEDGAPGDVDGRSDAGAAGGTSRTPVESGPRGDSVDAEAPNRPAAGADTGTRGDAIDSPIQISPAPMPRTSASPSPLSGGAPGAGSGLPGGGLGGFGGGNPLSGLSSGAGGLQGVTSPSGLSGAPSMPGAGTVDPSASFSRSMAASSGVASAVPPVSPPPSMPGTASPAESPMAGATSAPPAAVPAGLAASGAHTPVPAVGAPGGAVAGAPSAGGMILPPPGMGGPAAPAMAGGAAATIPATAPVSPGGGSAGSGGAVNPNAGATLVPASLVIPAAGAAQRARPLSDDTLAAAALAWSLARSGDVRAYPLDWAVVVFRSPSGSETVVMSGDGSGYVPVGVFLPRSARLMVSDSLVDGEFRQRWFGWADPARLLVEYAALRGHDEWKPVAASTTGPVDAFRSVGVEHTWVSRREEDRPAQLPPDWTPPVQDEMHVHRLQLEYADLYERLERLSDVPPVFRERVIFPLTQALMEAALQVEGYPQELRGLWEAVKANRDPGQAAWAAYNTASNAYFMQVGATRPGGFTDDLRPEQVSPPTHSYHRGQWTAARAMEHLGGWAAQPLPLADMAYAAAAVGRGDIRAELEPRLRMIEDELRRS